MHVHVTMHIYECRQLVTMYVMYIYATQSACDYACLRMYTYIYAMHLDCTPEKVTMHVCACDYEHLCYAVSS